MHSGLYEFNAMPFGLCSAPTILQCLIQRVLMGLESFCSVYVDDILVFSANSEEHVEHLHQIFGRLGRFGLKLHPGSDGPMWSNWDTLFQRKGVPPIPISVRVSCANISHLW